MTLRDKLQCFGFNSCLYPIIFNFGKLKKSGMHKQINKELST